MRRLCILAIVALMSAACGSANEAVQAAASTVAPTTAAPTTAVELEVSLLSGRDAIAANSGKAHVLWFWGAH